MHVHITISVHEARDGVAQLTASTFRQKPAVRHLGDELLDVQDVTRPVFANHKLHTRSVVLPDEASFTLALALPAGH